MGTGGFSANKNKCCCTVSQKRLEWPRSASTDFRLLHLCCSFSKDHDDVAWQKMKNVLGTVSQKRLKWILSECCNKYDAHIHFNCNMTKTLEQLKSYGNTKKERRSAVLVAFRRSDLNGRNRPLLIFGCYICVAVFPKTMMMWHDRK